MAGPEQSITDDTLDDLDHGEVITSGVYCCKSCIKEFEESPEFPVTGRMKPRDICSVHPENAKSDFIRIRDLELPTRLNLEPVQFAEAEGIQVMPLKDSMES